MILPTRVLITTPDLADVPGVFPLLPGQLFLGLKTPTWSTTAKQSRSGRLVRLENWSYPIWQFKVAYSVLRDRPPSLSEIQKLWAFFNTAKGAFGDWSYFDPADNAAQNEPFGVGDGVTTTFQLMRTVGRGLPQAIQEPVFSTNGAPVVSVNGAPTTAFTVSQGAVTFSSAPANGSALTWSGSFMFLCHFSKDELQTGQLMKQLWSEEGIEFESVKP